jgi:hypothetical protein
LKLREGYDRIATNNIIINNGLHPHVWYRNSGDIFKNNIVFMPYQPAIMDASIAPDGKWGQELDYNFYVSDKAAMTRFSNNGCDKNSIYGNPLFINPIEGDFRVMDGSPALKLGFVNFRMDQFGVIKPSLKAIAKTPKIPAIKIYSEDSQISNPIFTWMEIVLREPAGEEMSAFGVGFDEGGVALTVVPDGSEAAKLHFRTGDLIQSINGFKIKNIQSFKTYIKENTYSKKHLFSLIRNQKKTTLSVGQGLPSIIKQKVSISKIY